MKRATVHVLGSGTCYPEPDRVKRAHPGFYIRYGENPEDHLLLECSAGIAERLEAIGVKADEIKQMAISHAHPDHFAYPQFVQSAHCAHSFRRTKETDATPELELYVPFHIAKHLELLDEIHFEETIAPGKPAGLSYPRIRIRQMSSPTHETVCAMISGGSNLIAFPVLHGHGKVDAVAFRLEITDGPTIAYSGDTGMCDGLIKAALNADLFICEASARVGDSASAVKYGHLNPFQAGQAAKLANAKSLLLTHYSGHNSDELMLADCLLSQFNGEVCIAKDGMTIKV